MFTARLFLVLAIGMGALSGCGKASSPAESKPTHREPVKGELLPLVQSFKGAPGFGPCENRNYAKMLEIARELDQRAEEIEKFAAARIDETKFRRVQVGPISMQERINPSVAEGWSTEKYGWGTIIADREKMGQAGAPIDWYWLNFDVRGILSDDKWRIGKGFSYVAKHTDEEVLGRLRTLLSAMAGNGPLPKISDEDRAWMRTRSEFEAVLLAIDVDKPGSRSETANLLSKAISGETRMGVVMENNTLRRVGDELVLPMFAGPFAGATETISRYVESMWKSASLKLRIEWVGERPDIYRMLVGPGANSRPFVRWTEKSLTLHSDNRVTSIAHEFGHILGFEDRYYPSWDESACEYAEESNADDIMSNSSTGKVLEADFKALEGAYPKR